MDFEITGDTIIDRYIREENRHIKLLRKKEAEKRGK